MTKQIMTYIKGAILYGFFCCFISCNEQHKTATENYETAPVIVDYTEQLKALYHKELDRCITLCATIQSDAPKQELIDAFKNARLSFKKLEPIMAFFNAGTYKSLNRPNLPIVDEDDNAKKVLEPTGFQVLEELVTADTIDVAAIEKHRNNIQNILNLEIKGHTLRKVQDYHIQWMLKDAYLRILSLGISGFDSPVLLHSLPENKATIEGLITIQELFKDNYTDEQLYQQQIQALQQATAKLSATDFNAFDRYDFIKNDLHPLLDLWDKTVQDWKVTFPFDRKFSNASTTFFSEDTFNLQQFSPNYHDATLEIIDLGEQLFHDTKLSASNRMSCFSCHQPEKAFTDGLQFSKASDGTVVSRNAPTLLYSGLQASQFYDARAASLETQIIGVVENEKEFHNNLDTIVNTLKENKEYVELFQAYYKNGLTSVNFRHAIASYVRTLSEFNSKFDLNITNKETTLTEDEITGFNLFMGKGKCATCHFAPIFNGTVPPNFTESELEVLGVPDQVQWANATVDDDLGRYMIFKIDKKKHAFKTPTVRNSSKTAPYMHNGIYNTLDDVIKFYNVGGGAGIGIELENQTLPPDELGLSATEIQQIIAFLNSLEDTSLLAKKTS